MNISYFRSLNHLKDMLNAKITDRSLEAIAGALEKRGWSTEELNRVCSWMIENWEPKPTKQFPLVKDFKQARFKSNPQGKSWLEKRWQDWAEKLFLTVEEVQGYTDNTLEACRVLRMKPKDFPSHSRELTQEQRDKIALPTDQEFKVLFESINGLIGGKFKVGQQL